MQEGAFLLADCLGFRGIWNRVDPARLIEKLQSVEKHAAHRVVPTFSSTKLSFGPMRIALRLLSDTVALSVQYEPKTDATPNEAQRNILVGMACEAAAMLSAAFIDDDIPLPLRGCISYGPHLCEGNFLVGPAVDEAAEYMDEPEGAFIWVLPSANEFRQAFIMRSIALVEHLPISLVFDAIRRVAAQGVPGAQDLLEHESAATADTKLADALRETFVQILAGPLVIDPYTMPIKRAASIDAAVVNPLILGKSNEDRARLMGRYDQFLRGDRIDIWTKRQNTLRFLQVANEAAAKFQAEMGQSEKLDIDPIGNQPKHGRTHLRPAGPKKKSSRKRARKPT